MCIILRMATDKGTRLNGNEDKGAKFIVVES